MTSAKAPFAVLQVAIVVAWALVAPNAVTSTHSSWMTEPAPPAVARGGALAARLENIDQHGAARCLICRSNQADCCSIANSKVFAAARRSERSSEGRAAASLRRLLKREVTPRIAREARRIIAEHYLAPLGFQIAFEADGQAYVARIERHYHPPGGDKMPWGHHAGVSVFVARPLPRQ